MKMIEQFVYIMTMTNAWNDEVARCTWEIVDVEVAVKSLISMLMLASLRFFREATVWHRSTILAPTRSWRCNLAHEQGAMTHQNGNVAKPNQFIKSKDSFLITEIYVFFIICNWRTLTVLQNLNCIIKWIALYNLSSFDLLTMPL